MSMKRKVTEYTLYRWRYVVGYVLGLLAIAGLLAFSAMFVPGSLRTAEMESAVTSTQLAFDHFEPHSVINLPYHALQQASFAVLGITTFSIKLPSLVLGFIASIGMYLLIRTWFRPNTAIITTMIGATTPLFLFAAQDGTPLMYALALSIWLLVVATYVSRRRAPKLLWKVIFFALLALNLYTPLGIYLNIAIISTVLFHPHIRYLARNLSLNRVVAGSIVALLLLTPLIYSISMQPRLGLVLLGIPEQLPNIGHNALTLGLQWFGVGALQAGPILTPMFSLGVIAMLIIGIWRFILIKHTARSYITWLWATSLVPLLILNPDYAGLIFPLALLMVAMGVGTLIGEWYKLFPRNPYARVAGLLPLGLIMSGLMLSGAMRYGIGYYYMPDMAQYFSSDRRLLDDALIQVNASDAQPAAVVVPLSQRDFYQAVAEYEPRMTVLDSVAEAKPAEALIVQHDVHDAAPKDHRLARIITDRTATHADRFYVYSTEAK